MLSIAYIMSVCVSSVLPAQDVFHGHCLCANILPVHACPHQLTLCVCVCVCPHQWTLCVCVRACVHARILVWPCLCADRCVAFNKPNAHEYIRPRFNKTLKHITFSRRFYPKQLTLHSSYSFTFYQLLLSLGIEPMILALLAPCSTIWATGKFTCREDSESLQETLYYNLHWLIFRLKYCFDCKYNDL